MSVQCSGSTSCSSEVIKCDVPGCRKTFPYRMKKQRHIKKDHPDFEVVKTRSEPLPFRITDDEKFACLKCEKEFAHRPSVYRHYKTCSQSANEELVETQLECPVCGDEFNFPSRLTRHLQRHHNENNAFSCEKCGKLYKRKDHYNKHVNECSVTQIVNKSVPMNPDPWLLEIQNEAYASKEACSTNIQSTDESQDLSVEIYQYILGDHESCSTPYVSGTTDQEVPDVTVDSIDGYLNEPLMMNDTEDNELPEIDFSGLNAKKTKSRKTLFLESFYTSVKDKEKRNELYRDASNSVEDVTDIEAIVCRGFIKYLIELKYKKQWKEFAKVMVTGFPDDLGNSEFISYLGKKLGMRPSRLINYIQVWWENDFMETRGRKKTSLEIRQLIHDEWLENSIPSVDCRNGRQMINISEKNFLEVYSGINVGVPIEYKKNKRGTKQVSAVRRITTCTLSKLQSKIHERHNIKLPVGTIHCYQPFFMRLPTEKEKEMCLHKFCLNLRLKFNAVMDHSRKNNGPDFHSISDFFTYGCACEKGENGYWLKECCLGHCKNCKNFKIPNVPDKTKIISYYQFEVIKEQRLCKKTKKMKECKRTERVNNDAAVSTLYADLINAWTKYLYHRYQIENDKTKWKSILSTTDRGSIFWMDYSENLTGTPKFEPQDSHFSKKQYSLHCTVGYNPAGTDYYYHLSNDTTHDSVFTFFAVEHLLSLFQTDDWQIIRFKSDNCSVQYKCLHVFPKWRKLAMSCNKTILVYYGVSGHGKGLVDAMSSFGVKHPLRKSIIQKDFFFQSAEDIYNFLKMEMLDRVERHYFVLEADKLEEKREADDEKMAVAGCLKRHMFAYFPDGSVQVKDNICDCVSCLTGHFVKCKEEQGKVVVDGKQLIVKTSDCDSHADILEEEEGDEMDSDDGDWFPDEDTLLDEVTINSFAAIFSHANANELFYVVEVLDKRVAEDTVTDSFNHEIVKGQSYISARYLEKVDENIRRGFVKYKLLKTETFIRPSQVFHPCVKLDEQLKMTYDEYNFLADCTYIAR